MQKSKTSSGYKPDGLIVSTVMLLVGSVILFVFSIYMWQKFVANSDQRIFWRAIEKALTTEGVKIVADDSSGDVNSILTLKLNYTGDIVSESQSEYKDSRSHTILKGLSDKTRDYIYYEKNEHLEQPELKEFEGTWVDVSVPGQTESKTLADQLTNGSLIFIGNMSVNDRKNFITNLKGQNVYAISKTLTTQVINDREVRVYKVSVNSVGFNKALKDYLRIVGFTEASAQITENDIQSTHPVIEIAIDSHSGKIYSAGYPTISSAGAREYYDWDIAYKFDFPKESISGEELQAKLDRLNSSGLN